MERGLHVECDKKQPGSFVSNSERSTLASTAIAQNESKGGKKFVGKVAQDGKDKHKYTHYGQTRHNKDTCWDQLGCLLLFNKPKSSASHSVSPFCSASSAIFSFIHDTIPSFAALSKMTIIPEDDLESLRCIMSWLEGNSLSVLHTAPSPSNSPFMDCSFWCFMLQACLLYFLCTKFALVVRK